MSEPHHTVLITGGTGLVGSFLAEKLLSSGYNVRCLLRYPDKRRWLGDLPVEVVPGDVTKPETLPQAVAGVDSVVHCAALTKAKSVKDFYVFNTQGAVNLYRASIESSPPPNRFVFVSSQAAVGPTKKNHPTTAHDTPNPITDYGKSKLQAEQEILRIQGGTKVVIIRPTAVFGPRDRDIFIYIKTMVNWRIKPFFGSSQHQLSLIYVHDLVDALTKAIQAPSEHLTSTPLFVADPTPYTWAEVTNAMEQTLGHKTIPILLPAFLVTAIAAISELFAGKNPGAFNRQKAAEMLAESWACDVQPTMNSLGWNHITPLQNAINETILWYREHRWIKS